MKQVLEYEAIDSLTAVELPDRHLLSVTLLVIQGLALNFLSFNTFNAALQYCNNNNGSFVVLSNQSAKCVIKQRIG